MTVQTSQSQNLSQNLTQSLARFVAETPTEGLPETATRILQLSLLDWMAVGLAGQAEPVAQICRDMVLSEAGLAQATLFGNATRVPMRAAALSNGTTSHALDYDDTHFAHIGHPSVAVISAALAVAEARGASGAEFQTAALIGGELSVRLGLWLGRSHYQGGFHQTATAGAFGAAAAAARLIGLDAVETAAALGLMATRASGLKSQFGSMGKPYNAGIAASNGVEIAALVAAGFQPNPAALEGPQGFGATHIGEGNVAAALDGLGRNWLFETVSHKFHACCHGLHATLEALATIDAVNPGDIERIEILTHPRWMSVCNQPEPHTGLEAKFSYRMVCAMALLGHSTAALSSYADALCRDPKVLDLRNKVSVTSSETIPETGSEVSIVMADGANRRARFDLNSPMTYQARQARVLAKAAALLGQAKADDLWAAVQTQASPKVMAERIAE